MHINIDQLKQLDDWEKLLPTGESHEIAGIEAFGQKEGDELVHREVRLRNVADSVACQRCAAVPSAQCNLPRWAPELQIFAIMQNYHIIAMP
jgi:hypothetical protein